LRSVDDRAGCLASSAGSNRGRRQNFVHLACSLPLHFGQDMGVSLHGECHLSQFRLRPADRIIFRNKLRASIGVPMRGVKT